MDNTFLSLIIPAYNEEVRLRKSLPIIYDYLEKQNFSFEVIVIDDGSFDETSNVVRNFTKDKVNLILLQNNVNRGKGYSVKKGMLKAKGTIRAFIDADLSVPIQSIFLLINSINQGSDIAIASRNISGAWIKVNQPLYRRIMGRVFRDLANLLLTKNISDITCGTKGFRDRAAEKIFSQQRLDDWSFDVEILFLAKKYSFKINEIPVDWSNFCRSKVRLPYDIVLSLWGLIKIRLFDFLGYYDKN